MSGHTASDSTASNNVSISRLGKDTELRLTRIPAATHFVCIRIRRGEVIPCFSKVRGVVLWKDFKLPKLRFWMVAALDRQSLMVGPLRTLSDSSCNPIFMYRVRTPVRGTTEHRFGDMSGRGLQSTLGK